jgi:hypothetical protein
VPSAPKRKLLAVKRRRGDVVFYGLLAAAWVVAGAFALWNHQHHATAGGAATVVSTPATPTPRDPRASHRHHTGPRRTGRARTLSIDAARGPSWVAIRARSAEGPILYQGILDQGRSITERGTAFWTQVGAVENVDVRVDRHAVRLGRSALRGVLLGTGHGSRPQASGVVGS